MMQGWIGVGLAVGALALVAAAGGWATVSDPAWFDGGARTISLGLALFGAVVLVLVGRDRARPRTVLVAATLATVPAVRIVERMQGELVWLQWDRGPMADVTAVIAMVAAIGMLVRWSWARWGVLAGAACGCGSMVLNGIGSLRAPDLSTWSCANEAAICLMLLALVQGPTMARAFTPERDGSPWQSKDPLVTALRWTIGSNLAATAMLLIYAWTQPVVPETRSAALVLAAVLAVAVALCMLRSLLGALLLVVAGTGLLALTATTVLLAHRTGDGLTPWIASYYAAFWVPGGVISTATGVAMLRPLAALWRRTA